MNRHRLPVSRNDKGLSFVRRQILCALNDPVCVNTRYVGADFTRRQILRDSLDVTAGNPQAMIGIDAGQAHQRFDNI
jgi:hypothetical protein